MAKLCRQASGGAKLCRQAPGHSDANLTTLVSYEHDDRLGATSATKSSLSAPRVMFADLVIHAAYAHCAVYAVSPPARRTDFVRNVSLNVTGGMHTL